MNKRLVFTLLALIVAVSMMLSACGPAATEAPVITEAPATEAPTEVPTATEPPAPAIGSRNTRSKYYLFRPLMRTLS